ncbi:MAG: hypothetical protein ACRD2L_03605, partial [Terriglobia bacterium]
QLRAQRLQQLRNTKDQAIGNLRENLQQRRVLGSSFAQDTITRGEAEFAEQEDRIVAETFLQELEATHSLINEEFTVGRGQFTTWMDELNLQADIAAKLTSGATAALQQAAAVKADLAAKEAQASGQFFGQLFKPVANAIGQAVAGPDTGIGHWTTTVTPA